jgi:4-amino-4-deoxy-L-arabinose transferase-like glycosyltransferase
MLHVSIFVELLRARPALAIWLAALVQAALWTLVPTLFYAGPPGDLPAVLAVGHEFQLGTYLGPPLAFWLAEVAFVMTGGHLFGVYLLSQICVVVTYWAVFALGRSIVGAQHAALAVLMMVGVAVFTVPTPDFGPVILTMPLWAIILLHYWRAVGEERRGYWVALAVEIGLLLLTTYAGLLLVGLLALFTVANERARAALRTTDPWLAVIVAVIVMFPHLLWLGESGEGLLPALDRLRTPGSIVNDFTAWVRQVAYIIGAHAGLLVLLALLIGWSLGRHDPAPVIVRRPVDPFARQYVYFFAIAPALAATLVAALLGWSSPIGGVAPLVILSSLAVVVAAGDGIKLSHQRVVISAWFALLIVPPVMAVLALTVLPWIGVDLSVNQPAKAMASFFADNFQRRIGAPAPVVAGEPRTAALIALGSPSRPSLFLDATPERSPWVTMNDIKLKGGIVVWPTTDTAGAPPADIKEHFPDLVPELPRAFERTGQGRLPILRIGWAVIRPQSQSVEGQPPPTTR